MRSDSRARASTLFPFGTAGFGASISTSRRTASVSDKTLDEANPDDSTRSCSRRIINPDLLRQSEQAREFVRAFDTAGKPIATLCHGPWVLASAGLLRGRTMTSWPGIRDDLANAGARWLDQEVVRDGNLITSRGPQDLKPFVQEMIKHFAADAPLQRNGVATSASVSAPQRNEPPALVVNVMRWMPRPSLRGFVFAALAFWAFAPRLSEVGFVRERLRA